MNARAKEPSATIRVMAACHFVIPWAPWRGLTLGDVIGADPDAVFALLAEAKQYPCPPLLRRAVGVMAELRKRQLARELRRRQVSARERFVSVQL